MRPSHICQFITLLAALGLGVQTANAAGVIPLALTQQIDANGQPLAGCLTYYFTAGTVATPQQVYQDFALTTPSANPTSCDVTGRVPLVWIADGLVHVRLTTSAGTVVLDTTMQVLGPSGGGGGGGATVDPTAVAKTGDIKFRISGEAVTGWVIVNGTTIGSAASGATQRANADTQGLYIYLWANCNNTVCPVSGGRGASALADFTANKQIKLPAMQDRTPVGRDCMSGGCVGNLSDATFGNGGSGGFATTSLSQANLPNVNFTISDLGLDDPGHTHTIPSQSVAFSGGGSALTFGFTTGAGTSLVTNSRTTGVAIHNQGFGVQGHAVSGGSGTAFTNMPPYVLGNWLIKL